MTFQRATFIHEQKRQTKLDLLRKFSFGQQTHKFRRASRRFHLSTMHNAQQHSTGYHFSAFLHDGFPTQCDDSGWNASTSVAFLDLQMGPQWLQTLLFLFLGLLLLSDFQSARTFSIHNRSPLNFVNRLETTFSTIAQCRIFCLSLN